jgi:hypothetical protein
MHRLEGLLSKSGLLYKTNPFYCDANPDPESILTNKESGFKIVFRFSDLL